MSTKMINLSKTEIRISDLGLGIMQWGDIKLPKTGSSISPDVRDVYVTSLSAGINFIDTAEIYGNGKSELHLSRCLKEILKDVVIATKFMPFPWRLSKGELKAALSRSLHRLGLDHVDLYQIHWPFPPISIKKWMDAMADVVAEGLVKAVGVSNYSPSQMELAYDRLAKYKIPLASNQVRYNLLDRRPERNGLLDLSQKLDLRIIAYSPLERGILTGKYTPEHMPTDFRAWRYNKSYLAHISPLLAEIRDIGEAHGGKAPASVALNWLIFKGAVPIPGARNKQQAEENASALGWLLSSDEVDRLDRLSDQVRQKII
jgi:aryl-alcohol dehydrogenase-like predicted oxidoreductase